MCRAHATVRGLLGELVAHGAAGRDVVVDMEAGLEHLSRGTGRHVERVLAVLEPYYRSMETARRVAELARELGIGSVEIIANKVRDQADRDAIHAFCSTHGMGVIAEVPADPTLLEAERAGRAPIDHVPEGPAVAAVRVLAARLARER